MSATTATQFRIGGSTQGWTPENFHSQLVLAALWAQSGGLESEAHRIHALHYQGPWFGAQCGGHGDFARLGNQSGAEANVRFGNLSTREPGPHVYGLVPGASQAVTADLVYFGSFGSDDDSGEAIVV